MTKKFYLFLVLNVWALIIVFGCNSNSNRIDPGVPVDCGTLGFAKPSAQPRMGHADIADPRYWPWRMRLKRTRGSESVTLKECGATLIPVGGNKFRSDMVATAASCITRARRPEEVNYDADDDRDTPIRLPASELKIIIAARVTVQGSTLVVDLAELEVKQVREYPEYRTDYKSKLRYDIGLVRLTVPLDFDDMVRPICVPEGKPDVPEGKPCAVTGFEPKEDIIGTVELRQLRVNVQKLDVCARDLGVLFAKEIMICAVPFKAGASLHYNDNGGPLSCNIDKRWTLSGTVLFDHRAAITPFLFTFINEELATWLNTNAADMSKVDKKPSWWSR